MLFNSFPFVLFVGVTFALYYLPLLRGVQVPILIMASLFFYAYDRPFLVLLLLLSILINASTSHKVIAASDAAARKRWAVAGVSLNLAVLLVFKYSPLAARSLHLAATAPDSIGYILLNMPLPIGISFFTFQGISLVIDVYRQDKSGRQAVRPRSIYHHYRDTALFKSFFPQLVAGPIVKAHDFYPQIGAKRLADVSWDRAFQSLVVGYFLKMVVADNLKDLTFWIADPYFMQFSTLTLLALLFGYSIQIFADFSGYSLIAIGLARLFGYELMENFNFPYISQSLAEFWRRWHISLSTWLREYLYIPLGGNRLGPRRTYLNLMLVMVLGGLWHGAAWNYAIWGAWHGAGLAIERRWLAPRAAGQTASFSWTRAGFVFCFVTLAWLLFKLPRFEAVMGFGKACCTNLRLPADRDLIVCIGLYSLPVVIYHALAWRKERGGRRLPAAWREIACATCLVALLVNSGSPGAFIYFQF